MPIWQLKLKASWKVTDLLMILTDGITIAILLLLSQESPETHLNCGRVLHVMKTPSQIPGCVCIHTHRSDWASLHILPRQLLLKTLLFKVLAKNQSLHAGRQLLSPRNVEKRTLLAGSLPFKWSFRFHWQFESCFPHFLALTWLSYRCYWQFLRCSYQSDQLAEVLCLCWLKDCAVGLLCSSRDTPWQGLGNYLSHSSKKVTWPYWRATT